MFSYPLTAAENKTVSKFLLALALFDPGTRDDFVPDDLNEVTEGLYVMGTLNLGLIGTAFKLDTAGAFALLRGACISAEVDGARNEGFASNQLMGLALLEKVLFRGTDAADVLPETERYEALFSVNTILLTLMCIGLGQGLQETIDSLRRRVLHELVN